MAAQRERILRAAIRCVGNLGLERASVAEIRKEAGLSAGAIYKHFTNKEEIIAEALRFAAMTDDMLPLSWPELKTSLATFQGEMGFDPNTIIRARLQLFAASVRPGPLHDMLRPMIELTLSQATLHLMSMEAAGEIKLRLTPLQSAMAISAIADGLTWIGLATDRTTVEIAQDIEACLECLILLN
jgi:AcrR family transcriptional regulator